MANGFRLYKGDQKVKEGASPLVISGLPNQTQVKEGEYEVTRFEDSLESTRVKVPAFLTLTALLLTIDGVETSGNYAVKDISQADYLALATKYNNTLYRVQPTDSGSGRVHFLGDKIVDLTKKGTSVLYSRNYYNKSTFSPLAVSGTTGVETLSMFGVNISTKLQVKGGETVNLKKISGTNLGNRLRVVLTKVPPVQGLAVQGGDLLVMNAQVDSKEESVVIPNDGDWRYMLVVYSQSTNPQSEDLKVFISKNIGVPTDYYIAPEDILATTTSSGGGTFG